MSNRNRFLSSSNPFLSDSALEKSAETQSSNGLSVSKAGHMTVSGAVNKSLILGAILTGIGIWAALRAYFAEVPSMQFVWIGLIGGIISLLVANFKPSTAPISAPLYAAFEGLALGTISGYYAKLLYPGVVINSVLLTMLALVVMLILYKTGIIKPTEKFKSIVMTATGAIAVIYLVNMVMHMFGSGIPYLHEAGIIGVGISLLIIGVASLNLILDFDQFKKGEEVQAPKHYEWLAALGLMVTLVWLYLEILRLVAMFSGRD
jgi:uncharacterized YccA/Bax inhibitor family protein